MLHATLFLPVRGLNKHQNNPLERRSLKQWVLNIFSKIFIIFDYGERKRICLNNKLNRNLLSPGMVTESHLVRPQNVFCHSKYYVNNGLFFGGAAL